MPALVEFSDSFEVIIKVKMFYDWNPHLNLKYIANYNIWTNNTAAVVSYQLKPGLVAATNP